MFCGAKPRTFARGKAEPRGLVMRNTLSVILGFGRSKRIETEEFDPGSD